MRQHAIIDLNTKTILTISQHIHLLIQLRGMITDCVVAPDIAWPYYMDSLPIDLNKTSTFVQWSFTPTSRKLSKTETNALTDELIARSALTNAKRDVLQTITDSLSFVNMRAHTGVAMQETIYAQKVKEAEAYTSRSSEGIQWFPYVMQHAEHTGLSPEQAAEDILFASKLAHDTLLRTEGVRMTYFKRLREAATPAETLQIQEQFFEETRGNALQ